MLIAIFDIYSMSGSTLYFVLIETCPTYKVIFQFIMWLCFFLSFAVKMPMIPFHLWLPEAHVEAPLRVVFY